MYIDFEIIVLTLIGLAAVAQIMSTFMWAIGWWLYKTDPIYRVKYGKPSFWLWNQIKNENQTCPKAYRKGQRKKHNKVLEAMSVPELESLSKTSGNLYERNQANDVLNSKYRKREKCSRISFWATPIISIIAKFSGR